MNLLAFSFEAPPLETFVNFPFELYREDPHWIPPFRASVKGLLAPSNPFFKRGAARHFLAMEGDAVRGRISAIYREVAPDSGLFGFFECVDDYAIAQALVREATQWLAGKGVKVLYGPMAFDTWHTYRFKYDGFAQAPFFMEPYNKRYYAPFFERMGFKIEEDYFSKTVMDVRDVYQRMLQKTQAFLASDDVHFTTWRRDRPHEELRRLYALSVEIFKGNWGYQDITEEEFMALYQGALSLLDPELVFFARNKAGRDVGFLYAFPEYGSAIQAMHGENGWWAKMRFAMAKRKPMTLNIKSMGVVSEARRTRLGAALMTKAYEAAVRKGYRQVNLCLIRQGNFSGGYDVGKGAVCGRYGLYSKPIV